MQTRRWLLCTLGLCSLVACSTPPPRTQAEPAHWEGRFALSYQDQAGLDRYASAMFELSGSPEQGRLLLVSPLGTQLANIRWSPGEAILQQTTQTTAFTSLEELLVQTLGTVLPIQALFHWLEGQPTPGLEWETDLSELAQGRLSASHHGAAAIRLRILLSR